MLSVHVRRGKTPHHYLSSPRVSQLVHQKVFPHSLRRKNTLAASGESHEEESVRRRF